MTMFRELFRRKRSLKESTLKSRYFMRVISGPLDELFQFTDKGTSDKAKEAFRNGEFFRFSTLKGRQCVVNFRQVHAVNFSQMPEIASSSQKVVDVLVYLANVAGCLEIPAELSKIDQFLNSLASDGLIVSLGDWQFDKHEIVIVVWESPTRTG